MLRGYRGSLLALIIAIFLLGAVIATRPPDDIPPLEATRTALPPTSTLLPTLTPAPTKDRAIHEAANLSITRQNPP